MSDWDDIPCRQTIKQIRQILGLPPVYDKSVNCKNCQKIFVTTFKYERAQQKYCSSCRHAMSADDYAVFGIGR